MRPQSNPSTSSSSSFDAWQAGTDHARQSNHQSNNRTHDTSGLRVLSRQPSASPLDPTEPTDYLDEDEDDGDDGADQRHALKFERHQLRTLQDLIGEINGADHVDLAKTLYLFNQIKLSDEAMKTLARHGNDDDRGQLRRFGGSIGTCIFSLERFLQTGEASKLGITIDDKFEATNTLLQSLSAIDVHGACNGLAPLFDESLQSTLFSKAQLAKLGAPLRKLNDALLLQTMTAGLPRDLPSNGCLLDILNLQSRLLKGKLVSSDSKFLKTFFVRAIVIFGEWATTSGRVVSEDGIVVSRQLGKVFVQLNTARSFGLIKLDKSETGKKNRQALGQLALALASAEALDDLTSKPGPANPDGSPGAAIRVVPKGVEVTNISNTIKDFLEAGFIAIGNDKVQQLLRKLMKLVTEIPPAGMLNRSAQTLANCANLIRGVYECAVRPGASAAILQSSEFSAAAKQLLQLSASADFWRNVDWFGKPDQTLANFGSFIKAMDKWGKTDAALMRSAVAGWAAQVHALEIGGHTDGASVASLLSALVTLQELAPAAQMPALIEQCLSLTGSANLGKWEARSRAQALRAALAWRTVKAGPGTEAAIDALLAAGPYVEDSLPYLQAIMIRCKQDIERLPAFEKTLRPLLPHRAASDVSPIELAEIEKEIKRREAKEPVPTVREAEPVPEPATPAAVAPTSAQPAKRLLVGESDNPRSALEIASSSHAASFQSSSSSTSSSTAKPKAASGETWNQPKKTARVQRAARVASPPSSTEPLVKKRGKANPDILPATKAKSPDTDDNLKKPASSSRAEEGKVRPAATQIKPSAGQPATASKAPPSEPAPLNARRRAALEKQWFDAIRNPGLKGRMAKLEELIAQDPDLSTRKTKNHKRPLVYAITNGEKDLVDWLLDRMAPMQTGASLNLLMHVFDEPVLARDEIIAALKHFLSRLDKATGTGVAEFFVKYKDGSSYVQIPVAYQNALESMLPADSPQRNQSSKTAAATTESPTAPRTEVASKDHGPYMTRPSSADPGITPEQKDELIREVRLSAKKASAYNPLLAKIVDDDLDGVDKLLNNPGAKKLLRTAEPVYGMDPLAVASILGRASIIEKIVKFPAGLASALTITRFGFTPLHLAIDLGSKEAVQALLKASNAIDQIRLSRPGVFHHTTVHTAANAGNADILQLILQFPEATDLVLLPGSDSLTPLQMALARNDAACAAELLMLSNADMQLRVKDRLGRNVLARALEEKSLAVGELILQRPEAAKLVFEYFAAGMNVLAFTTAMRDEKTVDLLLASPYAEALAVDNAYAGGNALMASISEPTIKSFRIAQRLLGLRNAEQQAIMTNSSGMNALMAAAENGYTALVRQLLQLPNAAAQAGARVVRRQAPAPEKSSEGSIWEAQAVADQFYYMTEAENRISVPRLDSQRQKKYIDLQGMNAFAIALARGENEIAELLRPFEKN